MSAKTVIENFSFFSISLLSAFFKCNDIHLYNQKNGFLFSNKLRIR